jgi:rare lipoprotein A
MHFTARKPAAAMSFNQNDFTAAHRSLPFGTIVSVTNKKNGKNAIVRINDRGPYVKSRIIDLTKSAARKIDMVPFGVVPVKIQVLDLLDHIPLNDSLMKTVKTGIALEIKSNCQGLRSISGRRAISAMHFTWQRALCWTTVLIPLS